MKPSITDQQNRPKMHLIIFIVSLNILSFLGPVLAQTPDVQFDITEELAIGTPLGDLREVPNLFSDLTQTQRQSLTYGILDQASLPASLFNISNGIIYAVGRIDRERFCLVTKDCILKINILVSSQIPSQIYSKVVSVFFSIEDINDNAPKFERDRVVLEVTEKNSLEQVLKITGANDRDFKEEFKVRNYTLDGHNDVFKLTASETLDGSSEIDLKLLQSLDREKVSSYDFTITAYDGGSPPKSAVLPVTVRVTDQNDNEPVFLNDTYNVVIEGKVVPNQVILQVSATDNDEGENARITYDFSNIQKPMLENTFRINSTSGEISVIGPLTSKYIEFIVEAQDSGSTRLKSQSVVKITVIRSERAPPRVAITTLGAGSEDNVVSVQEPSGRGHFVALLLVENDENDISDVMCEIDNNAFRMEPERNKGFKIALQGPVDRESRDTYNLTVICRDIKDPALTATASFTVKIEDANDNNPRFLQRSYSRTMKEGKKFNEFVLQVSATDKDIGPNAEIRYSIDDPEYEHIFKVDPITGVISAVGELDREIESVINFNVVATDLGKPPLNSSVRVEVILEDINDNAPQFTKKVFIIRTREEMTGGRIIENLHATDDDIGDNGKMDFFFTGSLDGADGSFTVMKNGSIYSSARLDREDRVNYTFSVMVRDRGTPPLMSSASVLVEVTDINDNSPAILFPKTSNHTILISTFPETGVVLSKVIAYDDDAGDNGNLRFTIVSGNEDRAFEISDTTGEFKIADASRLKNNRKYNVSIIVSDRGLPPKFNTTSLNIEVHFDNKSVPYMQGQTEKHEDYIIIVGVVLAITIIFSTIIIIAICIVFHKDRSFRRKPQQPKAAFQNLPTPENLSDDEKVHTVTHESRIEQETHQNYSMNNLSPPSKDYDKSKSIDDTNYFQMKVDYSGSKGTTSVSQSQRGKAVSFSIDEQQQHPASSTPRKSSSRDDAPSLSTFSAGQSGRPYHDDGMYHQRTPMTRQGDDVTSDTSADTNTSDSGQGNSVDDVTFEQIMKSELSPRLSVNRLSAEIPYPPRKHQVLSPTGRASYHVRFAQETGAPPDLPPKSNLIRGAKPYPRSHSDNNSGFPGSYTGANKSVERGPNMSTFGTPRQMSLNSIDDDASTTTSGSYVISPDDVRMEALVGSDIIV